MAVNRSDRFFCLECESFKAAADESVMIFRGKLYHKPCFGTMINFQRKQIATSRALVPLARQLREEALKR
jgi:hypothetical protein